MLSSDGYYECELWNGHRLQVWTGAAFCILNHPIGCNVDRDECRERVIRYIHNEGLFDEILDVQITLLDSYAEDND